jgi:hypothetical protein
MVVDGEAGYVEAGNKPVDIARASGFLTFSIPVEERERNLAVTSTPHTVDVTEWLSKCLFHQRTPARLSDESN